MKIPLLIVLSVKVHLYISVCSSLSQFSINSYEGSHSFFVITDNIELKSSNDFLVWPQYVLSDNLLESWSWIVVSSESDAKSPETNFSSDAEFICKPKMKRVNPEAPLRFICLRKCKRTKSAMRREDEQSMPILCYFKDCPSSSSAD